MAKYKLKEDFYEGTVGLKQEPVIIYKKGTILDTQGENFVAETEQGLIFSFDDPNKMEMRNILVPFNSLTMHYTTGNIAFIVFGVIAVGFVSYKLIKKYT